MKKVMALLCVTCLLFNLGIMVSANGTDSASHEKPVITNLNDITEPVQEIARHTVTNPDGSQGLLIITATKPVYHATSGFARGGSTGETRVTVQWSPQGTEDNFGVIMETDFWFSSSSNTTGQTSSKTYWWHDTDMRPGNGVQRIDNSVETNGTNWQGKHWTRMTTHFTYKIGVFQEQWGHSIYTQIYSDGSFETS